MYKWLSTTVNQCILHLVYFKFYTIYFYVCASGLLWMPHSDSSEFV